MQRKKKSIRKTLSERFNPAKHDGSMESRFGQVVILGAKGVGKTSIANRMVFNYFTDKYDETTSEQKYEVDALLEVADEASSKKEKLVLKKSFKKSVMGHNRPNKHTASTVRKATLKVSVSNVIGTAENVGRRSSDRALSHAYLSGVDQGLKKLTFSLIDTPSNMADMHPLAYQAMRHNASGFFLVCSFDNAESLKYIETILKDLRATEDCPVVIIANKADICEDKRVLDEKIVRKRAEELNLKYCCASMASRDGYEAMAQMLLNEINVSAERREYEESLPENDAYIHADEYY